MASNNLNLILKEYEYNKRKAELDLESRKSDLYNSIPRLNQIENELNNYAIKTAKSILHNEKKSIIDLNKKIEKLKKERENLLTQHNIDLNYLTPNYKCKFCCDTGYITHENKKTEMCSCLKQRLLDECYNNSNLSNINNENFSNFNDKIFSNSVDSSKFKYNISPRENINNIKKRCQAFIDNFDNPNTKNLLFTGNTGLGKTFMSNCIANELLKKGKTVLYQTAPVLLESIIDAKMNKSKSNYVNNIDKDILNVDLLIIDDLGTECLNSMKLSELFTILNTRLLNLNSKITKTIISTNLGIENIFNNYEERIGSRIAGFYDIYYFFGDDLRFKKT